MTYWVCCYTHVGCERKAQEGIEALDRGTLLPTFAMTSYSAGLKSSSERPVLNRYVLIALYGREDHAWSQIAHVEGVHRVICTYDADGSLAPSRVSEKEVQRLMWTHMTGALNRVQGRASNGCWAKPRKRRARPRPGKRVRSLTYIKGANHHATHAA